MGTNGQNERKGLIAKLLIGMIKVYQFLTPWLNCCRFHPSCSEYTLQAIKGHGPFYGSILGIYRILRCQPFCKWGEDPVPNKIQIKLFGKNVVLSDIERKCK